MYSSTSQRSFIILIHNKNLTLIKSINYKYICVESRRRYETIHKIQDLNYPVHRNDIVQDIRQNKPVLLSLSNILYGAL